MQVIDIVPLWVFFALVLAMSLVCHEVGFRIGHRRKLSGHQEPEASLGSMVSSTLALLAFLLGFTFNIAANRFDDRRVAVLDEANAIGTAYLRADFFEPAARDRIKKLFREYVNVRVQGINRLETRAEVISKSESIQNDIWQEASVLARENKNPICALFINSLNELIDLHSKRVNLTLHARVPFTIWMCLLLVSALSMLGLGYHGGFAGNRSWMETLILITAFALVMLLVADLDRPQEGFITVGQDPMIELRKHLGPP